MKRAALPLLILSFITITFGCSRGSREYAVLAWPDPASSLSAGTVVELSRGNGSEETTLITSGDTETVTDQWRLLRFETREAAETYSQTFREWQDTYARSLRTALPVRERQDQNSTRVYRLRDGELMKVLGRSDEAIDVGGLEGYWYEVLTREGITGWVFGYHLELTGASGRALDPQEEHDGLDRIVRDIASVVWRPEYFHRMVSSGRINLNEFAPRFGLFGDWEDSSFRLVLPEFQQEFSYEGYRSGDGRTIEFDGTSLELVVTGDDRLTVNYSVNGRRRTTDFRIFDEDISLIIDAERERRDQLLQQFLNRGYELISTAYGQMTLSDQGLVNWTDFQRLVPNVMAGSFDGSGRMEFSLYLGDDLRGRYDGALRITGSGSSTAFLYSFTDDGVRFVYVPSGMIDEDQTISAEPISPVVIFFRFIQG
jgi:hypothetical protein